MRPSKLSTVGMDGGNPAGLPQGGDQRLRTTGRTQVTAEQEREDHAT